MQKQPTIPTKYSYKIKDWKSYNQSLVQRGSITIWLEESVLRQWRDIAKRGKVVGEHCYPDSVIQCCLMIGLVYHQPLRQTTGLVASILSLMGYGSYQVPDASTLCRRQSCLPVEVSKALKGNNKIDIAIDSTGLKVYGEGEWKVRKHGVSKHRTWCKLNIAIDIKTQQIVAVALTTNSQDDAGTACGMLKDQIEKISSVRADGGYDDFKFRKLLGSQVKQIIPPPRDAVLHLGTSKKAVPDYLEQRNEAVSFINDHDSEQWKIKEGYHQRSLNEVAMFRYKTIFTGSLRARKLENQKTEAALKCKILNMFSRQGMPRAYKVA